MLNWSDSSPTYFNKFIIHLFFLHCWQGKTLAHGNILGVPSIEDRTPNLSNAPDDAVLDFDPLLKSAETTSYTERLDLGKGSMNTPSIHYVHAILFNLLTAGAGYTRFFTKLLPHSVPLQHNLKRVDLHFIKAE